MIINETRTSIDFRVGPKQAIKKKKKKEKKEKKINVIRASVKKLSRPFAEAWAKNTVTSNKRDNSLLLSVKNMSSYFPTLLSSYLVLKQYATISIISK